jgi:hypothetical protein
MEDQDNRTKETVKTDDVATVNAEELTGAGGGPDKPASTEEQVGAALDDLAGKAGEGEQQFEDKDFDPENFRRRPSDPTTPPEAAGATPYLPMDHKYELMDREVAGVRLPALVKVGTDEAIEDWIIFRAQDAALIPLIKDYHKLCNRLGSPPEHLEGIKQLLNRVRAYQAAYPDKVKIPD